jgi:hypothetical protein
MKLCGGKAKEEVTAEHQGRAGWNLHTQNPTGPRYRRSEQDKNDGTNVEVVSKDTPEEAQEKACQRQMSLPTPNIGVHFANAGTFCKSVEKENYVLALLKSKK